jgi:signal transduction histidine kinase
MRTIRARVALATFLVLAVIFAVAGRVIDTVVRHAARATLDEHLRSDAETLAALTRYDGKRVTLELEDDVLGAFSPARGGAYFQISSARGLVERSRSLDEEGLPRPVPEELILANPLDHDVHFDTIHGPFERRVRMVTLVLTRAKDDESDGSEPIPGAARAVVAVQVARSLAPVTETRDSVRVALGVALPLALALGTVGAFLVAGRATRPIAQLSREAQAIGEASLGSRLDVLGAAGELRDLALTLNAAFDRVEGVALREQRFASDAAHELRTPLTVVRARLELALSREREPGDYRAAIGDALEANGRLEAIVAALLLLGRSEGRKLAGVALDLGPVLARVAAASPGTTLALESALPVSGDPVLLERLFTNLVENGVRHGGGSVAIEASVQEGRVLVSVLDRGPGLAPDLALFERFARGDASRTRATGGAGLGLALARAIARAHGGDVTAGPRDGGGAAFHVTLPSA